MRNLQEYSIACVTDISFLFLGTFLKVFKFSIQHSIFNLAF